MKRTALLAAAAGVAGLCVAAVADPLPPNASFADGLRSMEIIEAVVTSAQSDGAAVAVPAPSA